MSYIRVRIYLCTEFFKHLTSDRIPEKFGMELVQNQNYAPKSVELPIAAKFYDWRNLKTQKIAAITPTQIIWL